MSRKRRYTGIALALSLGVGEGHAAESGLRIAAVDVEGGSATLYVTPEGRSLLVDAGWPSGMGGPRPLPGQPAPSPDPSSAERIVAAAKALGVSKIDYLLTTHYHIDHVGGLHDLVALMPVEAFVDHGPNRELARPDATPTQLARAPAALYAAYEATTVGKRRVSMKPGDVLKIDGLTLTAVSSDGETLSRPLPGAGKPNPACASASEQASNGGEENARSLGFVAEYGKARILALGDTTWNVENKLACPAATIGPVDLLITTHHGSNLSSSPPLIASVTPTVAVTANGATKGGDAESFDTLKTQPSLKDIWQLHTATRSPDKNPPADFIANPADRPDAHLPLHMRVEANGTVTVSNPRNGFSRTYPRAR